MCPSLVAPSVRVHMRRFIGSASASGADASCCGDPLMVMVEGTGLSRLVAESRVVLSEISMAREAAAIAAARSVVAGSAPPPAFDSVGFAGGSEGIGRSSVPEMSVEVQSELRSGCILLSLRDAKVSLAFQGWAMSQHEEPGVFGGVQRVLHGCDEAVRGLELLELAATGAQIDSLGVSRTIAVGSQIRARTTIPNKSTKARTTFRCQHHSFRCQRHSCRRRRYSRFPTMTCPVAGRLLTQSTSSTLISS